MGHLVLVEKAGAVNELRHDLEHPQSVKFRSFELGCLKKGKQVSSRTPLKNKDAAFLSCDLFLEVFDELDDVGTPRKKLLEGVRQSRGKCYL